MADHEGKHKSDSEIAVRKIFIGGLSYSTDDDKLRKYFSAYGPVQDAVVMKDPVSRRSRGFGFITFMDIDSVDNALDNEPHVIDARKVEAKRAVPRSEAPRESGAKPAQVGTASGSAGSKAVAGGGGSTVPVRTSLSSDSAAVSSLSPASSAVLNMSNYAYNKIFVGGLHYDTRDADFKAYFEKYGRIITAEVMFNRETHKSRGFGFIVFELEKSAELVCTDKQHIIAGKAVEVKRAVPRSKIGPGLQSQSTSAAPATSGAKSDPASGSSTSSSKTSQLQATSAAAQGKVSVGKATAGAKGAPSAPASTTASTAAQALKQQHSQLKKSGASVGDASVVSSRSVASYAAALRAGNSNDFESRVGSETDSFAAVSLSDLSISARLLMSSAADQSASSLLEGDHSIFGGGSLSRTSSLSETIASHEQRLRSYSMELMQDAVKSSSTPPFHGGGGQVSAPTGIGLGIAALNKSSDQEFSRSNSIDSTPVKSAHGVPPLGSALSRQDTISSSRSNSIDWSIQGNKVVGSPLLASPSNPNAPGTSSPLSLNWLSPTITPMEGVAVMPSLSLDSKEEHSVSGPLSSQADVSPGHHYSPPRGSRAQTQGQVQGQYQVHGNPYVQRNGSPPIPFFGVPSPNAWAEMMGAQQGYPPLPAYPGVGGSAQGIYYPQDFYPQGYPPMGPMDPQRPISGYYPYPAQDIDQGQERGGGPPPDIYYGQQMYMQYPHMMQQQPPGFYTGRVDNSGSDSQDGVLRAHSASIASAGGASGGSAEDLVRGARAWSTGSIASAFSGRGSEGTSRSNENDSDDIFSVKDLNQNSRQLKISGTIVSDISSKTWSGSTQS